MTKEPDEFLFVDLFECFDVSIGMELAEFDD